MKAVITVIGHDKVGIIARVSALLSESNVNILDITQTIMQDIFTMVMITDVSNVNIKFTDLVDKLADLGNDMGLEIRCQHEDIFNSMHKI
ncbi:MAG: ACT domain-containing protein [Clostridia bacterium]|nr:ACT domain-containing protein [Clostridia bacterium]